MEKSLFGNISESLKGVAVISCILGFIGTGIFALGLFKSSFLLAILIGMLGCLCSWLSSIALYGLGQAIENSEIIINKLNLMEKKNEITTINRNSSLSNHGAASVNGKSVYGPWKGPNN